MLGLSKRKTLNIISGVVMVLALIFSAIPYAYAAPASTTSNGSGSNTSTGTGTGANTAAGTNSTVAPVKCAVEKIGWFVCPVMEQLGKISDNTFQYLSGYFLSTNPALVGNNTGTQTAWGYARTIANIMFIIAFLIIILSQVTGYGISNYGLKKMIPRLLVAAIAVNVSYYLCQLAVDLSNIFGYAIENALVQIANGIGPSVFGTASQLGNANTDSIGGGIATAIIVGVLASAAMVWVIMGPMVAIILMVVITLFTIVVILLLRKALIVLLVVISPIAIVMYLLPNTEGLFTKWRKMFINLLMVFPVVGLLFGAGQLASTIVLVAGAQTQNQVSSLSGTCGTTAQNQVQSSASNPNQIQCNQGIIVSGSGQSASSTAATSNNLPQTCNRDANCHYAVSWLLGLTALGIAAAPLIAVWPVLKGALSAAGSIGGKITSGISKGSNTLGLNKWAEGKDDDRQGRMELRAVQRRPYTGLVGRRYRKRAETAAIRKGVQDQLGRAKNKYIAKEAKPEDSELAEKMAGGSLFRNAVPSAVETVRKSAEATLHHDLEDAIKNAMHDVELLPSDKLVELIEADKRDNGGGFSAKGLAALQQIGKMGDAADIRKAVVMASTSTNHDAARIIGQSIESSNPGYLGAGDLARIKSGEFQTESSYNSMVADSIDAGTVTQAKLAGMSKDSAQFVHDTAAARDIANGNTDSMNKLAKAAAELHANNNFRGTVGKQADPLNAILRGGGHSIQF